MYEMIKIDNNNEHIPLCKSSWEDLFDCFVRFNKVLSKAASWGLRGWDLLLGAAEPARELVVELMPEGVAELLWEACEGTNLLELGALDEADKRSTAVLVLVLDVDEPMLALDLGIGFGLATVEGFFEAEERVVIPDIFK